jgi:integrase
MARTVRDAKLETRTARLALKASGKPYWRSIDEGLHLGYRKGSRGGKWVMRRYIGGQSYIVETIGTADDIIDADGTAILTFSQAQALARQLFVERKRTDAGLPTRASGPYTVGSCLADYLAWLEQHRKSARVIRWTAEASILPQLGGRPCANLTTDELRRWQAAQAMEPGRLRTKPGQKQRYREVEPDQREEEARRRKATANRKLVILKAALNHAWREKKIPSDEAWRSVKPYRETDIPRSRYLTVAECQQLINAADPDLRLMVQAALLTGCRYAELAQLIVSDFNFEAGTLRIRTTKAGFGRHVILTDEGISFFQGLAADHPLQRRMLLKANGRPWLKSHQHRPMRHACDRAHIEPPICFHVLRHTWASLAIMNSAPLMVVARNLGHTDTRMVERHYGHLAPSYIAAAIRAAAPRFGTSVIPNLMSKEVAT